MRTLLLLGAVLALLVGLVFWKVGRGDAAGRQSASPDDGASSVLYLGVPEGQGESLQPHAAGSGDGANTAGDGTGAVRPAAPPAGTEQHAPAATGAGPEAPAGTAPESSAAPAKPVETRYVVRQDDTLYSILRRAYGRADGVLVAAVAAANQLADPSALTIDQVLILPQVEGYPAPQSP